MTDVQKTTEILDALVGFDTTSRNTNLPLIGWVEDYLTGLGVSSERVPYRDDGKTNLWATIGPADVPGTILSGHTDVVPVDGQAWASDPFRLAQREGRLYGRGATDMKGYLACCLAAVPAMQAARLARPIHLAFSYDEEVGCVGVIGLVERLQNARVKPAACFVGEPTQMGVIVGHKGKRSFRVAVRGFTVHSSLAPHGVNAVEYAARLIVKIREISDRLGREGARDALYDVPWTTGHTGLVHGGTALNIVPDECSFEFEFRPIAADDPDALVDEVKAYARDVLEPEMRAVVADTGITFHYKSGFPGLETPGTSEIAMLANRLAGAPGHAKVAFGTEAGRFALAGIPSVVIGPGSIDQAHKADEYIAVDQLAACGAFLDRLIAHSSA